MFNSLEVFRNLFLFFQELTALGEAVGTESRGVAPGVISRLKHYKYQVEAQEGRKEGGDPEQYTL